MHGTREGERREREMIGGEGRETEMMRGAGKENMMMIGNGGREKREVERVDGEMEGVKRSR